MSCRYWVSCGATKTCNISRYSILTRLVLSLWYKTDRAFLSKWLNFKFSFWSLYKLEKTVFETARSCKNSWLWSSNALVLRTCLWQSWKHWLERRHALVFRTLVCDSVGKTGYEDVTLQFLGLLFVSDVETLAVKKSHFSFVVCGSVGNTGCLL